VKLISAAEESQELVAQKRPKANPRIGNAHNEVKELDAPIHRWWRFILAFPPHLVGKYLDEFGIGAGDTVLDPFSGTGTTLVEAKKRHCIAVGTEALDFCHLASTVKTRWEVPLPIIERAGKKLNEAIAADFGRYGMFEGGGDLFAPQKRNPDPCELELPAEQAKLIGKGFISERPLKKLLVLRKHVLAMEPSPVADFFKLALGCVTIPASNVGFGPEIYKRTERVDFNVWDAWCKQTDLMIRDLRPVSGNGFPSSYVFHQDCRNLDCLKDFKIDAVITSPPYPNEKNYARITRLECVMTDCIVDKVGLKRLKKGLMRSNSANMYVGDEDFKLVEKFGSVQKIANDVERRRVELNKDSGWERLYPKVVREYFGAMYRHMETLKPFLRRGAKCAYVVGDQMSFLMVHIKTGEIIAELADDLGYKVEKIDLWRERWSTASKIMLREEVVIFSKR
jgi:DNA modification methylase